MLQESALAQGIRKTNSIRRWFKKATLPTRCVTTSIAITRGFLCTRRAHGTACVWLSEVVISKTPKPEQRKTTQENARVRQEATRAKNIAVSFRGKAPTQAVSFRDKAPPQAVSQEGYKPMTRHCDNEGSKLGLT